MNHGDFSNTIMPIMRGSLGEATAAAETVLRMANDKVEAMTLLDMLGLYDRLTDRDLVSA